MHFESCNAAAEFRWHSYLFCLDFWRAGLHCTNYKAAGIDVVFGLLSEVYFYQSKHFKDELSSDRLTIGPAFHIDILNT